MPLQVLVSGPGEAPAPDVAAAHEVGRLLARAGAVVLCGGGGGVMAAAASGARSAGGLVVAVRPDTARPVDADAEAAAEADVDTPGTTVILCTGLGEARNAVLVGSADAVVVVGDSWGTLSELALARRAGIPVVSLGRWRVVDPSPAGAALVIPGVEHARDAAQAVARALAVARAGGRHGA